jgi:hypothetical protein
MEPRFPVSEFQVSEFQATSGRQQESATTELTR